MCFKNLIPKPSLRIVKSACLQAPLIHFLNKYFTKILNFILYYLQLVKFYHIIFFSSYQLKNLKNETNNTSPY